MARTTKKELESIFSLWLKEHGFRAGAYVKTNSGLAPQPGYVLDYAAAYGGYRIEYLEASTGHRTPFGDRRHSASELVAMLRFSMDTARELKQS